MSDDGGHILVFGEYELDFGRNELRHRGRPVELQATPLRVLLYLAEQRDRAVPGDELLDRVWPDALVTETSLSRALTQVRHAVGDDGVAQRVIRTRKGLGYRFVAEVEAPSTELDTVLPVRRRWQLAFAAGVLAALAIAFIGTPRPSSPQLGKIGAVAVLSLENLSGDPEQEYVADGMTVEVISELQKIGALRVPSWTTVRRYKGTDLSLPEIAAELDVEAIVEGAVIQDEDRIRVTVSLIDVRGDEAHLWSGTLDRARSDVLKLLAELAIVLAEELRIELTLADETRLAAPHTVVPGAHSEYLQAVRLVGQVPLASSWGPSAISHLERAVELDPEFAPGWARLAEVRLMLGAFGLDVLGRGDVEEARAAANQALKIDPRLVSAHMVRHKVLYYVDWDTPRARLAFERALELDPNHPAVLDERANTLIVESRAEEGLALSERLLRLDPLNPQVRQVHMARLYYARQFERLIGEFERDRGLLPEVVPADVVPAYYLLGRFEEAYHATVAFVRECGPPCASGMEALERGWAEGGYEGALRSLTEKMIENGRPAVNIAMNFAQLNDVAGAFAWLERGYQVRDPQLRLIKFDPLFDDLHSDPRWDDLLRRVYPDG